MIRSEITSQLYEKGFEFSPYPWFEDYASLGLDASHSNELVRLIEEFEFDESDPLGAANWAPRHAWRALAIIGDLRAISVVRVLMEDEFGFSDYDLPYVAATIGSKAITPLEKMVHGEEDPYFSTLAVFGLQLIAQADALIWPTISPILAAKMRRFETNDLMENTALLAVASRIPNHGLEDEVAAIVESRLHDDGGSIWDMYVE